MDLRLVFVFLVSALMRLVDCSTGNSDLSTPSDLVPGATWSQVKQFNSDFSFSSVATRENGQIVLTDSVQPTLYVFDPTFKTPLQNFSFVEIIEPTVLYSITKISGDKFALMGACQYPEVPNVLGNLSVWEIELTGRDPVQITKKKLFDLWDVDLLWPTWGSVAFVPSPNKENGEGNYFVTYGASNTNSTIGRYDTLTKSYHINAFEPDPLFESAIGCGFNGPFGLSRGSNNTLWFSNSGQGLTGIVHLNPNGTAAGKPRKVTTSSTVVTGGVKCPKYNFLNIAVDSSSNQWITLFYQSLVAKGTKAGKLELLDGKGGPVINDPSDVALGSGNYSDIVYVSTFSYLAEDSLIGGAIYAINTTAQRLHI